MGMFLKFRVDVNESMRCAWLWLAEQGAARLALTRELLCLGFAFLSASTWVDSWALLLLCCCCHRYCVFSTPDMR